MAECRADCNRTDIAAIGLCRMHAQRHYRGQSLNAPKRTGGVVKYQMAHLRVKALWGVARNYRCVTCGDPAKEWAYDGADPRQLTGPTNDGTIVNYSAFPEFYKPLCLTCHRNEDTERGGRRRKPCIEPDCSRVSHAKGRCQMHYRSSRKAGVS